jgi:phosphoglycolate phosphatase
MKRSCVIFDCDGTLVDTLEDIAFAANQALALYGFPPHPTALYSDMVGRGIVRLATQIVPEEARTGEMIQKIAADTGRIYFENLLAASKPYPGIRELVAELKAKKIKLAVLSNKPDSVLRLVIEGLFPAGTFDAVCGERPGGARKPDPSLVWDLLVELDRDTAHTIFVGDSEVDMETARNAGCYPLGVSWGFRPCSILEAAGAANIIDRPEELWPFIKGLVSD